MGRAENNFKKRFGDPPRITVTFAEKPCDSATRKFNNERIAKAFAAAMSSIVGREVTPAELLGPIEIPKVPKKAKVDRKSVALDYQI